MGVSLSPSGYDGKLKGMKSFDWHHPIIALGFWLVCCMMVTVQEKGQTTDVREPGNNQHLHMHLLPNFSCQSPLYRFLTLALLPHPKSTKRQDINEY
jgi:hypothetical protein